jgi:hypothetical protein
MPAPVQGDVAATADGDAAGVASAGAAGPAGVAAAGGVAVAGAGGFMGAAGFADAAGAVVGGAVGAAAVAELGAVAEALAPRGFTDIGPVHEAAIQHKATAASLAMGDLDIMMFPFQKGGRFGGKCLLKWPWRDKYFLLPRQGY